MLAPLGITRPAIEFRLPVDGTAEQSIDAFLAGAGLKARDGFVLVNPGAGRPDRRCPVASFGEVVQRRAGEGTTRVVVLWGPAEEDDARAIAGAATGVVA